MLTSSDCFSDHQSPGSEHTNTYCHPQIPSLCRRQRCGPIREMLGRTGHSRQTPGAPELQLLCCKGTGACMAGQSHQHQALLWAVLVLTGPWPPSTHWMSLCVPGSKAGRGYCWGMWHSATASWHGGITCQHGAIPCWPPAVPMAPGFSWHFGGPAEPGSPRWVEGHEGPGCGLWGGRRVRFPTGRGNK